MKIKQDWQTYVHKLRQRALAIAFEGCPEKIFDRALELGAGDCFQSSLLQAYVRNIISTDYYETIETRKNTECITFMQCDAERIAEKFPEKSFDLIFSSNLLEHLPNVRSALSGMHLTLRDDGLMVHTLPTPFMKFCFLLFHFPNLVISLLEVLFSKRTIREEIEQADAGNNPKSSSQRRSLLKRVFIKRPHGVSETNLEEFYAFSRRRWLREFQSAGFDVITVKKGPAASGYAFGLDRLRDMLEAIGLSSEDIYIIKKAGATCPYAPYFS